MNWDAISAISESLGTIAVLVTLIYLTVQVKDSKRASADSNRIERAVGIREGLMSLAEKPTFRENHVNILYISPRKKIPRET